MEKKRSNHGFGLAVFSLVLIGISFAGILSINNCVMSDIVAILSIVLATAAYFEARKANGPRNFTLIILIITIIGTFFIVNWSGTLKNFDLLKSQQEDLETSIIDSNKNDAEKMIEKAEELEGDSLK